MVFSRIKAQTLNFWTVALQEGGHIFVVVHLLCMQQIPGSRSGIATKDSNWSTGLKGLKEPGFFLPRLALAHCPLPSLTSFCFFFPGQMCFLCIGFPGSILTWSVSSLLLPVKGKRSLYCQSPCPVPFSCYSGLPLNIFYSGLHRVQDGLAIWLWSSPPLLFLSLLIAVLEWSAWVSIISGLPYKGKSGPLLSSAWAARVGSSVELASAVDKRNVQDLNQGWQTHTQWGQGSSIASSHLTTISQQ